MKRLLCMVRLWPVLVIGILSLGLAGCGNTGRRVDETAGGDFSSSAKVGERVTVQFSEPGLPATWEQTIGENGELSLPLGKKVQAAGKTTTELAQAIRDEYVPELYRRMSPLVRLEDRFYWVRGEVRTPNQYRYMGATTVLKAIASAGDFNDFADRGNVRIIRGGENIPVNAKEAMRNPQEYDIPIYPGDIVVVERRF